MFFDDLAGLLLVYLTAETVRGEKCHSKSSRTRGGASGNTKEKKKA